MFSSVLYILSKYTNCYTYTYKQELPSFHGNARPSNTLSKKAEERQGEESKDLKSSKAGKPVAKHRKREEAEEDEEKGREDVVRKGGREEQRWG